MTDNENSDKYSASGILDSSDISHLISLHGARRGIVTKIHAEKDNFSNLSPVQKKS